MFDTLSCPNFAPVISVRSTLRSLNFRRLGVLPHGSNEFVSFGGFACWRVHQHAFLHVGGFTNMRPEWVACWRVHQHAFLHVGGFTNMRGLGFACFPIDQHMFLHVGQLDYLRVLGFCCTLFNWASCVLHVVDFNLARSSVLRSNQLP